MEIYLKFVRTYVNNLYKYYGTTETINYIINLSTVTVPNLHFPIFLQNINREG